VTNELLHGYVNRGLDIIIAVTTEEDHTDFTAVAFRVGAVIEKTGLTAADTPTGFDVDLTLTAEDMDVAAGVFPWELVATFDGEVRTVAQGRMTVSEEPTEASA
jgi:hypothetical protein